MARQAAGASPAAPTTAAHYWRRRLAAVQTAIGTMPEAARGSAGFRELVLPPSSAFPLYDREMVRRADEAGHKAIPLTRASDPPGTDQVGLTAAECDFFRQHGFLVKRGLLPQSSLAECVDRAWSVLSEQQPSVVRSDRATHVDPQRHWSATKGPSTTPHGHPTTRNWPMTFTGAGDWNWHGLGSDPEWLAATSAHPNVLHMVEALIGGPVKVPTRNRGIYCIFPHADPGNLGPHHDWHPFDLGGMAYISAVAPFSGGPLDSLVSLRACVSSILAAVGSEHIHGTHDWCCTVVESLQGPRSGLALTLDFSELFRTSKPVGLLQMKPTTANEPQSLNR